jgi:hypothetical protein
VFGFQRPMPEYESAGYEVDAAELRLEPHVRKPTDATALYLTMVQYMRAKWRFDERLADAYYSLQDVFAKREFDVLQPLVVLLELQCESFLRRRDVAQHLDRVAKELAAEAEQMRAQVESDRQRRTREKLEAALSEERDKFQPLVELLTYNNMELVHCMCLAAPIEQVDAFRCHTRKENFEDKHRERERERARECVCSFCTL